MSAPYSPSFVRQTAPMYESLSPSLPPSLSLSLSLSLRIAHTHAHTHNGLIKHIRFQDVTQDPSLLLKFPSEQAHHPSCCLHSVGSSH